MHSHGHGKGSGTGSASANTESTTTAETTDAPKVESTTAGSSHYSKSYSGVIGHKQIDINVKLDYSQGGGSSSDSSTTAKAKKEDDFDFSSEDSSSSVFDATAKDNDIDPVDDA